MIRGRVPPVFRRGAAAGTAGWAVPDSGRRRLLVQWLALLCLLPLFGQTFYYLVELPVPYLLSKAWPVIVLPLTMYALVGPALPCKTLYAILLAYLIGISPIQSMIHFGSGLPDALTTTVKIWPFTFYLAFYALLAWMRPAPALLGRTSVALGALTFAVMLALWLAAPADWYRSDATTKLLLYEVERGYRIYMPMFFGLMLLFYLTRRFCERREIWALALVAAGFVMLLVINKQRVLIAAAAIVVLHALFTSTRGRWRQLAVAAALVAGDGLLIVLTGPVVERVLASFGGSLSVRQRSIQIALDFLGDGPLRWLFGVGATTRFSTLTFADLFGDRQFYLADIGWLGIVFEYGVVGAVLVAAVYVAGFFFTRNVARSVGTPFAAALADYAMFLLITSLVYSFVFTTGELATIMAMAAYLQQADPVPALRPSPAVLYRQRPLIHRSASVAAHAPAHPQARRPAGVPG